jgi:hypothetical protein
MWSYWQRWWHLWVPPQSWPLVTSWWRPFKQSEWHFAHFSLQSCKVAFKSLVILENSRLRGLTLAKLSAKRSVLILIHVSTAFIRLWARLFKNTSRDSSHWSSVDANRSEQPDQAAIRFARMFAQLCIFSGGTGRSGTKNLDRVSLISNGASVSRFYDIWLNSRLKKNDSG